LLRKNFVSCVRRHGEGALLRAKHRIVISQMQKKGLIHLAVRVEAKNFRGSAPKPHQVALTLNLIVDLTFFVG
jgi:hypothetical protein